MRKLLIAASLISSGVSYAGRDYQVRTLELSDIQYTHLEHGGKVFAPDAWVRKIRYTTDGQFCRIYRGDVQDGTCTYQIPKPPAQGNTAVISLDGNVFTNIFENLESPEDHSPPDAVLLAYLDKVEKDLQSVGLLIKVTPEYPEWSSEKIWNYDDDKEPFSVKFKLELSGARVP